MVILIPTIFILSLFFTFLFRKVGKRYKIYDLATDDLLKIHKESIPCLGGSSIILATSVALLFSSDYRLFNIAIAGFLIFLLGFIDDLSWRDKFKIKRLYKFLFLVLFSLLVSIILLSVGIKIEFFPVIAWLMTFACIFVLINAVNYQDGTDGLAGGLVSISLIGFIVLSISGNNSLGLALSVGSLLAVLGFLVFNFPPAKIFMGDSGSYYLGFVLAVLVMIFSKSYDFYNILGLMFLLGIPLFDGVFTNIRRIVNKKSIFLGDREHFYDRMLKKGLSIRKTVLLSYLLQTIFILIGLSIY